MPDKTSAIYAEAFRLEKEVVRLRADVERREAENGRIAAALGDCVQALAREKARADAAEGANTQLAVLLRRADAETLKTQEALAAARRECEGLRTYTLALRQQVEDTILVAKTDTDDEWITAYHFQTGAIHRLLAKAREPVATLGAPAAAADSAALADGGEG